MARVYWDDWWVLLCALAWHLGARGGVVGRTLDERAAREAWDDGRGR